MNNPKQTKGSKNSRLVILGEAPGANEEESGKLFSGAAGRLLDTMLKEVGLNRSHFYVSNAVKCRPEDNKTPTKLHIKTCARSYLDYELELVRPRFGLLLGNSALYAVTGRSGITKYNGTSIERNGTVWVAAFHPAAILRNPGNRNKLKAALLNFSRLVRDEEGTIHTEAVTVNDVPSLKRLLADLEGAKRVAIDVETWSPHQGHGRFPGGGLAWWDQDFLITHLNITVKAGVGYVIPLWTDTARWKDPKQVIARIKPLLEVIPIIIMHNGMYDYKCLQRVGINMPCTFDTMGAQYALDETSLKSLGYMSTFYLGAPEYKDTVDKTNMIEAPLKAAVEYGAKDSDYTMRLYSVMTRAFKKDLLSRKLFRNLLMPSSMTLSRMEQRGIPIDPDKFQQRRDECDEKIEEIAQILYDLSGVEFNPNSTKQLGHVLFNIMGLPILEETPKGKPSTNEDTLIRLGDLDDTGFTTTILDWRKWSGYRSRYFNAWSDLMDSRYRLHPNFKPFHTVTGRLSCQHPNMQQVPRDTFIRGIIGGRADWSIVEVDYSQVEMRLAAHYSQDRTMLRAFAAGRDIHMETAMEITGREEQSISSEERKKAKAVNFGFLYGMGYHRFISYAKSSYGLNVTEGEAKGVRDAYFAKYKSLYKWHNRQRSAARRRGWVISAIGRKRRLWDIESTNEGVRAEAERQAINSPVQSLASDMMLMSMIAIEPLLTTNRARLISTVHDSLIFEIKDDAIDEYLPLIIETMENLPLEEDWDCLLTVPIVVDAKYGKHWSEDAKDYIRV